MQSQIYLHLWIECRLGLASALQNAIDIDDLDISTENPKCSAACQAIRACAISRP
jgi:hypothetical protein